MAKLTYQQTKGHRVKNCGFFGVRCDGDYMWCDNQKKWVDYGPKNCPCKGDPNLIHVHSTHTHVWDFPINSHRAFCRRLKEWSSYLPSGVKFTLVSLFLYNNIHGHTK